MTINTHHITFGDLFQNTMVEGHVWQFLIPPSITHSFHVQSQIPLHNPHSPSFKSLKHTQNNKRVNGKHNHLHPNQHIHPLSSTSLKSLHIPISNLFQHIHNHPFLLIHSFSSNSITLHLIPQSPSPIPTHSPLSQIIPSPSHSSSTLSHSLVCSSHSFHTS